jgi:hypothetical protein
MQQNQKVADFLRNFVRDDRNLCHKTELLVSEKRGGDQYSIDKVVKGVSDHDHHAAASMIVLCRERLMRFALLDVAVAPQHEFFQHKENQDAGENSRRYPLGALGHAKRVRQNIEEHRAEQRTDRKADQYRHMRGARVEGKYRGGGNAQHTAEQARENDPG